MGFLDGLKRNLNIGGPKVHGFDGPNVCSLADESAHMSFTLVGGGSDAHVNLVQLELVRERRNSDNNSWQRKVVREARFDNGGAGWDVAAGVELPFQFDLPLNAQTQFRNANIADRVREARPDLSGEQADLVDRFATGAAGLVQRLGQADEMAHPDDRWSFHVRVDVADVAMDPAASIPTNLRSPGEFVFGTRSAY